MNRLQKTLSKQNSKIIVAISILTSISTFIYYYSRGLNVAYGDAASRLNIARKIIDNLTPGFAQVGNIWLPLPQILMLPFIWNNFLWHSGIAGYIMSGVSFVLLLYFLYKIGVVAFNSKIVGLLIFLVGLTNVNLIYMQTTAMSEVIFITSITGATYYLLKWAKYHNVLNLMVAGIFVSASTLIRYEGYFVFLAAMVLVPLIIFIRDRSIKKAEGVSVIFGTLAITGILIWAVYSFLIFKDPFYWKSIYSHEKSIISTDVQAKKVLADNGRKNVQENHFLSSVITVTESAAWMNGIIVVFFSTLGIGFFTLDLFRKRNILKNPWLLVLLLPGSATLFVFYTLYSGGIPLDLPKISIENILSRNTSFASEYNIRYGLNFFPVAAIFLGYLATKGRILKYFIFVVILVQLITTFWTPYTTIYQLAVRLGGSSSSANIGKEPASIWLKYYYDGGLIMISALKQDPEMFYLGLDYKNYIHEGTAKYWLESRKYPQRYATWIFMFKPGPNGSDGGDSVTKYLAKSPYLDRFYNKVYDDNKYVIYKIKTKPEKHI